MKLFGGLGLREEGYLGLFEGDRGTSRVYLYRIKNLLGGII